VKINYGSLKPCFQNSAFTGISCHKYKNKAWNVKCHSLYANSTMSHSKPRKSSSESQSNEWSVFIISSDTSLSSVSEVDSSWSSISGVEVSPEISLTYNLNFSTLAS
jgi:hypothetical protein